MAQTTVMNLNNVAVVNNKEEMTMNNTNANEATVVLAFGAEKLEGMKVDELKDACKLCGVKVSGKKSDLIERLVPFCQKELEIKIVSAPVAASVAVETKKQAKIPVNPLDDPEIMGMDDEKYLIAPTPVVAKAWIDMTPEEKLEDAKLPKWDKLVKATATEYVKQSLGVKWALFYKNTKSTTTKAEYLVKTKKLWGATSKVIKSLYGEKNCNENTIQQTLNAMVVRGYLNFQKVQGKNGTNIIFNASTDQMNAMWKLSK